MAPVDFDERLRLAMFAHLDRISVAHPDGVPSAVINSFVFEGAPMRLTVQPGIWKPAALNAALTIRTTFTPVGADVPYADEVAPDGTVRYKWRGTDAQHADNRALREAMRHRLPLAYFYPIAKGVYQAIYPVYLVDEDAARHEFTVDIGERVDVLDLSPGADSLLHKAYSRRLTLHRLHQALFRPRVLRAYDCQCALCRLQLPSLLDAAHIVRDGSARGDPIVPNGLAMCKIHHAAYDVNIIGIRPDHRVEVRGDVLAEIDGPMLRHGLQEMNGTTIVLPRYARDRPDPDRLRERYEEFRAAA